MEGTAVRQILNDLNYYSIQHVYQEVNIVASFLSNIVIHETDFVITLDLNRGMLCGTYSRKIEVIFQWQRMR